MPPLMFTPATWLERLDAVLSAQRRDIQDFTDYYEGRHKLTFASAKFHEAFGRQFAALAVNWCQLVVDASVERLAVEGFRFGDDTQADNEAWGIWQANALDTDSKMAHREAVKCGCAYVLVAPPASDEEPPAITVEHPAQVVVAHAPGNRRRRLAALKKWADDDGYTYATLYLPDGIHKFRSSDNVRDRGIARPLGGGPPVQWKRRDDDPGGANPLGVVPMVPIYNRPTMLGGGVSDLQVAVPIQDAINKEIADMLVASEFAAYPQRVLMGVEIPKDPVTGEPTAGAELRAAVSRLWAFANENVKIGEFQAADLGNYTRVVEELKHELAALTRTPPHYLLGQISNASGDALKAAEAGLVSKVRDKQIDFSDSWEEVMRLAFSLRGDARRAKATDAETIWRDPENRTEAEMTDAALKQRQIGVPLEVLWERLGYTPQQIERMKQLTGLPDRPPPGATTRDVPPVLGGTDAPTPSETDGVTPPAATAG